MTRFRVGGKAVTTSRDDCDIATRFAGTRLLYSQLAGCVNGRRAFIINLLHLRVLADARPPSDVRTQEGEREREPRSLAARENRDDALRKDHGVL